MLGWKAETDEFRELEQISPKSWNTRFSSV